MSTQTSERVIGSVSRPRAIPASNTAQTVRLVFVAAWISALVFYFLQYALRSAPGVMVHDLRDAFGLTPLGLTSLLRLYSYTFAGFAIIAGAALGPCARQAPRPIRRKLKHPAPSFGGHF